MVLLCVCVWGQAGKAVNKWSESPLDFPPRKDISLYRWRSKPWSSSEAAASYKFYQRNRPKKKTKEPHQLFCPFDPIISVSIGGGKKWEVRPEHKKALWGASFSFWLLLPSDEWECSSEENHSCGSSFLLTTDDCAVSLGADRLHRTKHAQRFSPQGQLLMPQTDVETAAWATAVDRSQAVLGAFAFNNGGNNDASRCGQSKWERERERSLCLTDQQNLCIWHRWHLASLGVNIARIGIVGIRHCPEHNRVVTFDSPRKAQ